MDVISQRQLRNDSAEVMRGVRAGQSFVVTSHGVPVARLVPIETWEQLRWERPARTRPRFSDWTRVRSEPSTQDVLEDLRGAR